MYFPPPPPPPSPHTLPLFLTLHPVLSLILSLSLSLSFFLNYNVIINRYRNTLYTPLTFALLPMAVAMLIKFAASASLLLRINSFREGSPLCLERAASRGRRNSIFFLLERMLTSFLQKTHKVSTSSYPNSQI